MSRQLHFMPPKNTTKTFTGWRWPSSVNLTKMVFEQTEKVYIHTLHNHLFWIVSYEVSLTIILKVNHIIYILPSPRLLLKSFTNTAQRLNISGSLIKPSIVLGSKTSWHLLMHMKMIGIRGTWQIWFIPVGSLSLSN